MDIKELEWRMRPMNIEREVQELRCKMIKVYVAVELIKEDMELNDHFLDWNVEEVKSGEAYSDADTMMENALNTPQFHLEKILGFMYSDSHNYIWNDIKQNWEKEVSK